MPSELSVAATSPESINRAATAAAAAAAAAGTAAAVAAAVDDGSIGAVSHGVYVAPFILHRVEF